MSDVSCCLDAWALEAIFLVKKCPFYIYVIYWSLYALWLLVQETEFKFPDSSAEQWGPPPSDMEPSLEKSVIEEDMKQPENRRSATNGNGSARLRNIDGSEVFDESQGHSWRAVGFITTISDFLSFLLLKLSFLVDMNWLWFAMYATTLIYSDRLDFQTPCRLCLHQIVPGDYVSHLMISALLNLYPVMSLNAISITLHACGFAFSANSELQPKDFTQHSMPFNRGVNMPILVFDLKQIL